MKITGIKDLCTPSYVYLVISTIAVIVMAIQNFGNMNTYCVGSFSCVVGSTALVFAIKVLYILFWTWILNLMCKDGHSGIAWFLVLLPFVFLSLIMAMAVMYQKKHNKEGYCGKKQGCCGI
jgi:hypothetical protein